jgi:hypothetical protein
MAAAEERRRADMGYDGPSDYSSTLARITAWSSAAGMQTYPENTSDTHFLGGEVLVLDVALLPADGTTIVLYTRRTLARLQSAAIAKADHELVGYPDPYPRVFRIWNVELRFTQYSSIHKYLWVLITDLTHVSAYKYLQILYSGVPVSKQGKKLYFLSSYMCQVQ